MYQADFASPIPFPEGDAIREAPVHWDLVNGQKRIRMAVPLFSFAMFKIYSDAVRSIKFLMQTSNGVSESTLDQLLTAKENGMDTASDLLESALVRFHEATGMLPDDLVDLLIAVSVPESMRTARLVLNEWAENTGIGRYDIDAWNLPETDDECKKEPVRMRDCLRFMCKHVLEPASCVLTLENLQRVNSEIKKKLLAEVLESEKVPTTHWNHRWLRWQEQLSREETASKKSPS